MFWNAISQSTDYGHPMKPFFIKAPNFWTWADNLACRFWGILGIFEKFINTHFGTVNPLSMFSVRCPSPCLRTFILKSYLRVYYIVVGNFEVFLAFSVLHRRSRISKKVFDRLLTQHFYSHMHKKKETKL